ncbi:PREDICTED: B-cell lymphoma/leukemia 10 [Nanorana parkeri]|uniref:B-cell lymphoma/leukemia 10 n=1 Tax=Nanorana parkeri TaxID=125878 RepID=UPI000854EAE5|nr:PREDICTED: B-cell lymphoma/leukemia 10 [Nanorana parkeri]
MTTLRLDEDDMADIKRDAIERLRHYLCDKLIAERHFDYLRSNRILNKDDTEEIMSQTTSSKRAGELLDRLAKNPKGLDKLIESIKQLRTQDFLIDKITDEVLRLKNMKLESYKGCCLSPSPVTPNGLSSDLYRQHSTDGKLLSPETESTVLFHPEGESSLPLQFNMTLTLTDQSVLENRTRSVRLNSPNSLWLPRPGEMGAPPLPETIPQENEDVCSSTPILSQFLPLRSTSPSSH